MCGSDSSLCCDPRLSPLGVATFKSKSGSSSKRNSMNSLWWLVYFVSFIYLDLLSYFLLDSFDLCESVCHSTDFLEVGGDPERVSRCRPRSSKLHCMISGNPSNCSFWCANPKTSRDEQKANRKQTESERLSMECALSMAMVAPETKVAHTFTICVACFYSSILFRLPSPIFPRFDFGSYLVNLCCPILCMS